MAGVRPGGTCARHRADVLGAEQKTPNERFDHGSGFDLNLSLLSRRQGAVNPRGNAMTLADRNPPRTAAPDDAKADVESHAYTWYDPDSADYDQADRWAPLDPSEDDDEAADDSG
jgi:hypothetical protein